MPKMSRRTVIFKIAGIFLTWRVALFLVAFFALFWIPQFGERFPYVEMLRESDLPEWVWSFGNFDGVHYLRTAKMGYEESQFSQAFFPLYPSLIYLFSFSKVYFIVGLLISNLFFLGSLYLFYRILRLDYSHTTTWHSVILLIIFPTSFYFGSVYSESVFLFFVLSSLFLLRSKHYLGAGLYAALSSATRIFGILLIPVFLVEIVSAYLKGELKVKSEEFVKALISLIIVPLGTLIYMRYLQISFYNPWYFLTSQPAFGAERTGGSIVFLPQVIFRYIKIIFSVSVSSLPFLNALLELFFTIAPLVVLFFAYRKIRLSYWIFTFGCLILPTLTGTLSSMPRYALMSFLLFPWVVEKLESYFRVIIIMMIMLGVILISLFTRGYWVA